MYEFEYHRPGSVGDAIAARTGASDGAYLAAVRAVYRELAVDQPPWRIVPCLKDGVLRSIEEIGDEIFGIVESTWKPVGLRK